MKRKILHKRKLLEGKNSEMNLSVIKLTIAHIFIICCTRVLSKFLYNKLLEYLLSFSFLFYLRCKIKTNAVTLTKKKFDKQNLIQNEYQRIEEAQK